MLEVKCLKLSIQNFIKRANEGAEISADAPLIVGVVIPARRDFVSRPPRSDRSSRAAGIRSRSNKE